MNLLLSVRRMGSFVAVILLTSSPLKANDLAADEQPPDSVPTTKELQELIVNGASDHGKHKIGHLSLSESEINKQPVLLGEHDIIKALQTTSGVVSGTEGFAGMYVRGGENDQNLFMVDGLPLLNVYHFGGLFSTFSTHSVRGAEFYKGNFPAIYAERASSITDISLKKPDYFKTRGVASLGLISGQLYVSTPVRKGSSAISLSLRRTWFDVFSTPAIAIINASQKNEGKKTIFHYDFTDLMLKFSATDRHNNDLSLLLFLGKDNFKLGNENFEPENTKTLLNSDINRMSWGNWGASLTYNLSAGNLKFRLQPYVSKAFASDSQENADNDGNDMITRMTTEIRPSILQAGAKETVEFPVSSSWNMEGGLLQTWYDYNVGNPAVSYENISVSQAPSPFKAHSKNAILSAFVQSRWSFGDIASVALGSRFSQYLSGKANHFNWEPRAEIKINPTAMSSISLGFSRMTQYAQQVSSNYIYLPSDAWLPTASYHKPLICDIYSLGFFKEFRHGFNLRAEAWWKEMTGIADFKTNVSPSSTALPWQDKLTYGKGRAYGLDLEIDGSFKSITYSVAYGLMWNWRKFPGLNSGRRFPAKYDNRHKVDITLGWKINHRLELTGQWQYMTGNRMTVALYNVEFPGNVFPDAPFFPTPFQEDGIDYFEKRNNIRIPAFHRLNLNLRLNGKINNHLSYHWDFGLYNAYCRMNPFTVKKYDLNLDMSNKGDYRKFKTLSLFPVLPSVSYTLIF